jgi:hypothetical protein
VTGRIGPVLLLVAVLWLLGGWAGLLAGVALAAWDRFRAPTPRQLLRLSLVLFGLVPLAVLARGLPTPATVSPDFASGNPVAHGLAGAALALLVLGILRDVRPPGWRPDAGAENGPGQGRGLALRDRAGDGADRILAVHDRAVHDRAGDGPEPDHGLALRHRAPQPDPRGGRPTHGDER